MKKDNTSIELIGIRKDGADIIATYRGIHSTPGREGTCLDFSFDLRILNNLEKAKYQICNINLGNIEEESIEAAFLRLGNWFTRLGDTMNKGAASLGENKTKFLPI